MVVCTMTEEITHRDIRGMMVVMGTTTTASVTSTAGTIKGKTRREDRLECLPTIKMDKTKPLLSTLADIDLNISRN
jgi:hypothetical protein